MMNGPQNEKIDVNFAMPLDEFVEKLSAALAIALYRAKLPYIPGDKIKASDLRGVAANVGGVIAAFDRGVKKGH